ncbi:hypothetical protein R1C46_26330 [Bacillus tropicus]
MKTYKAGHVEAVIKLFEQMSSIPDWDYKEWSKLNEKKNNAIVHMRKHAREA